MGKECDRDDAAKIDSVANKADDAGLCGLGDVEEQQGQGILSSSLLSDAKQLLSGCYIFKCGVGFLAWALWGFIPVHDSSGMQSDLFGDAKISTSVGRKTASRAQMRKLLIEQNAATLDNRRGKKRRSTEEQRQDERIKSQQSVPSPSVPQAPFDSRQAILSKTLHYLNAESLEKERQRNAQMMIRNVRDKLTSRRRNEDSISQELDRCYRSKRKPDQSMLDKQNAIANEIASLEKKLDELQSDECRRHSNMINQRTMELAAASSSDATITSGTDSFNESATADSMVEDVSCRSDEDDDDDAAVVVVTTSTIVPMDQHVHGSKQRDNNGCIECGTPSNHACRKCKKCVCSLCCGQRELENVWWCELCFATQSVANQQLIRDGNYDE
ncbi:hypothetical protein MHU86_2266 [Fragilaria crotonensis]|nr:hypothetical protein MHU86_2266 [Fragilaria crotonensis]